MRVQKGNAAQIIFWRFRYPEPQALSRQVELLQISDLVILVLWSPANLEFQLFKFEFIWAQVYRLLDPLCLEFKHRDIYVGNLLNFGCYYLGDVVL